MIGHIFYRVHVKKLKVYTTRMKIEYYMVYQSATIAAGKKISRQFGFKDNAISQILTSNPDGPA
jgi:hypothetical protein